MEKIKKVLIALFFEEWRKYPPAKFQEITVFVAHGEVCHAICGTDYDVNLVPVANLRCDHEEADTCMLLHTYYAADHSQSVLINIMLHHCPCIIKAIFILEQPQRYEQSIYI